MAYENYNFVSWTDGTPISSTRLAQMSTNIEQVKDVIDDKALGVLSFSQSTALANYASNNFSENEILYLKDEGVGGTDKRVTISENRYYKITVNIPTITVLGAGCEDSKYVINIYNGLNIADSGKVKIAYWEVTPHTFSFINVASGSANISNEAVKTATYHSKIAAGTYSVLKVTGGVAETNQSFFLTVTRSAGANTNNAPAWRIEGTASSPIQLYVEDAGGIN